MSMKQVYCDCNVGHKCPQGKRGASFRCSIWVKDDASSVLVAANGATDFLLPPAAAGIVVSVTNNREEPLKVHSAEGATVTLSKGESFSTERPPILDAISPWMPMTDAHDLAVIGKLGEECSELAARCFRCVIQGGLQEIDPDSKRTNGEELAREIADVRACIRQAEDRLEIIFFPITTMLKREDDKYDGFERWHALIDEELAKGK